MGEGTKKALPSEEFLYLILSYFALSFPASCLPKALPSTLLGPSLFFMLSDHLLPASKCSRYTAPHPISFLNLDLVSLSETRFSTKRFPSDTTEEKYVSIVVRGLIVPGLPY